MKQYWYIFLTLAFSCGLTQPESPANSSSSQQLEAIPQCPSPSDGATYAPAAGDYRIDSNYTLSLFYRTDGKVELVLTHCSDLVSPRCLSLSSIRPGFKDMSSYGFQLSSLGKSGQNPFDYLNFTFTRRTGDLEIRCADESKCGELANALGGDPSNHIKEVVVLNSYQGKPYSIQMTPTCGFGAVTISTMVQNRHYSFYNTRRRRIGFHTCYSSVKFDECQGVGNKTHCLDSRGKKRTKTQFSVDDTLMLTLDNGNEEGELCETTSECSEEQITSLCASAAEPGETCTANASDCSCDCQAKDYSEGGNGGIGSDVGGGGLPGGNADGCDVAKGVESCKAREVADPDKSCDFSVKSCDCACSKVVVSP